MPQRRARDPPSGPRAAGQRPTDRPCAPDVAPFDGEMGVGGGHLVTSEGRPPGAALCGVVEVTGGDEQRRPPRPGGGRARRRASGVVLPVPGGEQGQAARGPAGGERQRGPLRGEDGRHHPTSIGLHPVGGLVEERLGLSELAARAGRRGPARGGRSGARAPGRSPAPCLGASACRPACSADAEAPGPGLDQRQRAPTGDLPDRVGPLRDRAQVRQGVGPVALVERRPPRRPPSAAAATSAVRPVRPSTSGRAASSRDVTSRRARLARSDARACSPCWSDQRAASTSPTARCRRRGLGAVDGLQGGAALVPGRRRTGARPASSRRTSIRRSTSAGGSASIQRATATAPPGGVAGRRRWRPHVSRTSSHASASRR